MTTRSVVAGLVAPLFRPFHPRRVFQASSDGREFFEATVDESGRPVLHLWDADLQRSTIRPPIEGGSRIVPAGHFGAHSTFVLTRAGRAEALWQPNEGSLRPLLADWADAGRLTKVVPCGGAQALLLSRDGSGGTVSIVSLESAKVQATIRTTSHLLDAAISRCGQILLLLTLDAVTGSFRVLARSLVGASQKDYLATYPNSARAPVFTNTNGAEALILTEIGGETLLLDPLRAETLHVWPSREAAIEHVAIDSESHHPWLWCETSAVGQAWRLDGSKVAWTAEDGCQQGRRHLRLAAVLNKQAALLEDIGFHGLGRLYILSRGEELRPVPASSYCNEPAAVSVRNLPSPNHLEHLWRFEASGDRVPSTRYLVLLHGGPSAKDDDAFDPWVVALTGLGVIVVKANYPGSHGCGYDLHDRNTPFSVPVFLEWTAALIEQLSEQHGPGKELRLFVGGWSFGGYLALLAAAAFPSDIVGTFAISAPLDIRDVCDGLAPRWRFTRQSLLRVLGSTDDPDFERRLPPIDTQTLAKCRRVLVVYGAADDRIGLGDRYREVVARAQLHQHVRVLEFPRMGHFLSRRDDMEATLEKIAELVMPEPHHWSIGST